MAEWSIEEAEKLYGVSRWGGGYFTIGENGFDQTVSEVTVGYKFDKNKIFDKLLFQVGYKNETEDLKTSSTSNNSLVALVRYQKVF